LLALDGTQFSLTNTRQILAERPKPGSRHGRAAFAKLPATVLVELGLPVAVVSTQGTPTGQALAAADVQRIDPGLVSFRGPMSPRRRISERH
jgi:hypothetical protein